MICKALEIRDEGTMICALAVDMNPGTGCSVHEPGAVRTDNLALIEAQRYLLRRMGHACDGRPNILLTHINAGGEAAWNDPYGWGGRTWPVAHNYIIEHWAELKDGDVVDVQFILGETEKPNVSERFTARPEHDDGMQF